jgi:hypothetical protein
MIQETARLIADQRSVVVELLRIGLPYVSANAGMGNATRESLCKTILPSSDGSDGLFQWRDAAGVHRLTDMKTWCASQKMDWRAYPAQCQFFVYELKTQYAALYAELISGVKPLATLTANICMAYERPAAWAAALDDRIAAAQYGYDHFHDLMGGVSGVSPPVSAGPSASASPAMAPHPSIDLAAQIADIQARQKALDASKAAATAAIAELRKQADAAEASLKWSSQ